MTAPNLTTTHLAIVHEAAGQAYDKLRWHVGDNAVLRQELYVLARDSFREGLRQAAIAERNL
jgi:hypothetical protein